MLREFLDLEARGMLRPDGTMSLRPGDGAEKAAAMKLKRDGYAEAWWNTRGG